LPEAGQPGAAPPAPGAGGGPAFAELELADPVFISDLHLASAAEATTQAFLRFCTDIAPAYRELLVLGDLFEYWAGDDDRDSEIGRAVAAALAGVAAGGCRVLLMHGNRDFLIGARYAQACGASLLDDPVRARVAAAGGSRRGASLLLAHGDRYCTRDTAYQRFRTQVRNPAWQQQFLAQPLAARHALIGNARAQSEAGKREKAMEIMDVTPEAVLEDLKAAGVATMIHGHTHRPGHYALEGGADRWVLPDWDLGANPPRGGYLDLRGAPWTFAPVP